MHGAPAIERRDGAPALAPNSFPGAPGRAERGGRTPYVRRPTIEGARWGVWGTFA